MSRPHGLRSRLAALLLLPLALAVAAAAEEAKPEASPAQTRAEELNAKVTRGMTGTILKLSAESIVVRNLGEGSRGQGMVEVRGSSATSVSGLKKSWDTLAKGDLVAISYSGDPPTLLGVQVLPPTLNPEMAAAAGQDPFANKHGREFMGWIKLVDEKTLIVRTPDGPPGANRKGDVKTFVRQPDTQVELLRSSWSELKKGDRVAVVFSKGEPRPAKTVKVVLKGGEKPLPLGLATRLYDDRWDESVKDVDGIGEWPPDKPWPPGSKTPKPEAKATPAPAAAPTPAPAPAPAN